MLVHDENAKRGQWKIGIIEKLIVGKDGQVRGASVRMTIPGKGKLQYLNRPVQKLYPLEITGDRENGKETDNGVKDGRERRRKEGGREARPIRAAAQDARWKTKLLLDS